VAFVELLLRPKSSEGWPKCSVLAFLISAIASTRIDASDPTNPTFDELVMTTGRWWWIKSWHEVDHDCMTSKSNNVFYLT
jgi:hypothetical protein